MQLQQSSARATARSLRLAVHDAQIHDNSKALEIWERELNVVKHYREQLQEEGGAKALCQVIKTGADSRQTSVARFGPNAKCTGRNHAPGVTCYYCMTFPDRDKLKLKEETGMNCCPRCSGMSRANLPIAVQRRNSVLLAC